MNQYCIPREYTREEFNAISSLVSGMCANYDKTYNGCMLLGGRCYMLNKCYTGSCCKYFRRAVLPLDPTLERQIGENTVQQVINDENKGITKYCEVCGLPFTPIIGEEKYCSIRCRRAANIIKSREYKRCSPHNGNVKQEQRAKQIAQ